MATTKKNKLDLDWMDEISDLELPTMMTLDKGWHRLDIDLDVPPEVQTIEIPDKKSSRPDATKEVPQLEIWGRYYDLDTEWKEQVVCFWAMRPFKEICKQLLEAGKDRDGKLDLEVRVLMPTENKRTAEFRQRD